MPNEVTLQAALWRSIKTARDDAAHDLIIAQLRLTELNALLLQMKAVGMDKVGAGLNHAK
jgi:hypothetical protein